MKILATLFILLSFSSAFADVHCDQNTQTELHSTDEVVIGKRFTTSTECLFAAAAANEKNSQVACAPYQDSRVKGFSIYRLRDGKDLGDAIFGNFNDCQFSVLLSFNDAFCAPYKGKYTIWLVEENSQYLNLEYDSVQACIVASKNM